MRIFHEADEKVAKQRGLKTKKGGYKYPPPPENPFLLIAPAWSCQSVASIPYFGSGFSLGHKNKSFW